MKPELVEYLKMLAKKKSVTDKLDENEDICIVDYSGSNVDDAFDLGYNAGEIDLARQVLRELGIEF